MIELTRSQLIFVSWLFLSGISEPEFLVKAFLYISGLKLITHKSPALDGARWYRHSFLKAPFLITPDDMVVMADKCRFLLLPDEIKPLPWIRFARARHFRLYNATFEEYLMAENYYFAFCETKDPLHLDNLISVLYRRPWKRWKASKIQPRSRIFQTVDPAIKNSVFMWYIGFRSYVPKRCKSLFSGKKSGNAFSPRNYINGMVHQLTNGDITVKQTLLKQPVWDALDELEQRAFDALQMTKNLTKK
jgi:hypothetical protein